MPLETIDINDPDNQYPSATAPNPKPSDTRYVTYCAEDIGELMAVKKFYSSSYDISNTVTGYLGAYSERGMPAGN